MVKATGDIEEPNINVYIIISKYPNPENPGNTNNWAGVWFNLDGTVQAVKSGLKTDKEKLVELARGILDAVELNTLSEEQVEIRKAMKKILPGLAKELEERSGRKFKVYLPKEVS